MYPPFRLPLNEKQRTYEFPPESPGLSTTVIEILEPREFVMNHEGVPIDRQMHIIEDSAGIIHYVPSGWKHVAIVLNKPTPLTNFADDVVIESGTGGAS